MPYRSEKKEVGRLSYFSGDSQVVAQSKPHLGGASQDAWSVGIPCKLLLECRSEKHHPILDSLELPEE
eukprot:10634055-Prorocentrum_lima.AAC.1